MSESASTAPARRPSQPPPPPPPPSSARPSLAANSASDISASVNKPFRNARDSQKLGEDMTSSLELSGRLSLSNKEAVSTMEGVFNSNPFADDDADAEGGRVEEVGVHEEDEEERPNSLQDSDEEDENEENVDTAGEVASSTSSFAAPSRAPSDLMSRHATSVDGRVRSIDTQRAKNALDKYESDGEYEADDYDDMFTRRSSISQEPSYLSPSSLMFDANGTITSQYASKNYSSSSSSNYNSNNNNKGVISVNNYGIRVPKIKRGVIELQSQRAFRRWKKRYFHLERGSIIYFEPLHWYQEGEHQLEGFQVATELKPTDEVSVTIRLQCPTKPDICFKCHSATSKDRWMKAIRTHIQYANEMKAVVQSRGRNGSVVNIIDNVTYDRGDELTVSCLREGTVVRKKRSSTVTLAVMPTVAEATAYNNFNNSSTNDPNGDHVLSVDPALVQLAVKSLKEVIPVIQPVVDKDGVPFVQSGWLHKKGQWFPTIRRRFFLLVDGMLSYYKQEWDITPYITQLREEERTGVSSAQKKVRPPRALGKFAITHYQFRADFEHGRVEITMYPSLASPSRRLMIVYCDDFMQRDHWLRVFTAHSEYIKPSQR